MTGGPAAGGAAQRWPGRGQPLPAPGPGRHRHPRAGGRPRKRPDLLLADKGYAHDRTRAAPRRRAIPHNIPERRDQIARRAARGSCGGRPPAFSPHAGLAAETHVTILNANLDDAVARQVAGAQIL